MKKKGFTLVELLAVVVLLGMIALIITPTVRNMIKDSKQKLYDEQINLIEAGLKNWANANVFILPEEGETIKLSLGQLKQAGFIEMKINNPKNNKCFSNDSILSIKKHNNSYIYKAEETIDVDCNLIEDTPTIKLNGNVVEYLYIGDTYVEKGATAKASNGTDITSAITTTISGDSESIDTTKEGNYIVKYNVVNNGKSTTTIKNILVTYKYKNGIMSSMDNCINTGTCASGTLINVKVNNNQKYNFYVINDIDDKLTLIMDRNLGKLVAWVSKIDYNDDTNYGTYGNTSKGPITALTYLNNQTSDWTNINSIDNYTYVNNSNGNTNKVGYQKIEIVDGIAKLTSQDGATITTVEGVSRARLLTNEEARSKTIGCQSSDKSCANWIYTNLSADNRGYWLASANPNYNYYVSSIHYTGKPDSYFPYYTTVNGIRPVIEITK